MVDADLRFLFVYGKGGIGYQQTVGHKKRIVENKHAVDKLSSESNTFELGMFKSIFIGILCYIRDPGFLRWLFVSLYIHS